MFLATNMFRYGYWPLGLFSYVGNNFEAHKQKAGIYVDQRQSISPAQKLILMKMKLPSGSPQHRNLPFTNFQRCYSLPSVSCLLMTLQLYHPLLPLFPPVSNSSYLFTGCQPLDANCTTVLFKVLYRKIKFFLNFVCVFVMYYLCEKYYKPIQYITIYWMVLIGYLGKLCWT